MQAVAWECLGQWGEGQTVRWVVGWCGEERLGCCRSGWAVVNSWSNWGTKQAGVVALCRGGFVGQVQRGEFLEGGLG